LYEIKNNYLQNISRYQGKMKWGVPSYAGGKYYFVALKSHVNLGFSIKGLSKEKIALFQGVERL